jgi:PAS domain S-box-containing protein
VFPAAYVEPLIHEILLVPFRIEGQPIGTLWINAHSEARKFDREDARLLENLARFASAGYQAVQALNRERDAKAELERRVEKRTEALRASEERYRTLFETVDEGFAIAEMIYDAEGRAVDARYLEGNPAASRLTGGRSYNNVLLSENVADAEPYWLEIYDRVARTGEAERHEEYLKPLDRWYDFHVAAVAGDGEPRRLAILFQDVTERKRDEAALRESDTRHRLLIESWTQAIWETDADGVVVADSPTWRAYTGQTVNEWLGYGWLDAIHPDDRAFAERQWREAMAARSLVNAEFRLRAPDGGWRWTNVRAAPVLDADGNIEKWAGMNIDIDERKHAEAALRNYHANLERQVRERTADLAASHDLLQATINSSSDMIQVFEAVRDETGEIVDFRWLLNNATSEGFYGDVVGQSLLANNPGVVEVGIFDTFRRVVETGEPDRSERHYVHEQFDGWFYQSAVKLGDGVATTTKDISDWKAAQAEILQLQHDIAETKLRESEERLRRFGEASQDVLWIRSADTLQWEYLTPAFETIYGLSREEALAGNNYGSWLDLIVPEDRERATENIRRVRAGEHVTFEYRVERPKDGEIRWLRNTDFPITDASGKVTLVGGIGTDITAMKLAQEQVQRSEERLRSAVEVGRLGLWDWNVVTGEVHWSDEHFRMEGYGVGEVTPSYEAWRQRIHPDDRSATEAALKQAMESGEEYMRDFRVVHPNGSVHWLHGRGRFFYEDGRAIRMLGAMIDITERREWEERQQVLVAELQHRTRNLMGVVRSMSDKTARASVNLPDFRMRFRDRLEALSRVQGLLSRLNDHDRVTFDDLIRTELAAMDGNDDRVTLSGPNGVRLRSSTVQTLALALHELATNAVKYGALGQPAGRLSISWSLEPKGDGGTPWLHIDWRESGVDMPPANSAPRGSGQGRELIEQALPYQLRARTTYTLGPDGVHCTISIPVSASTVGIEDHA